MKNFSFKALTYPDFRLFWGGSFISQMGDQMQLVAIAWHLYSLTHSAASLGLIGLSSFLPILAFSLVGGVFSDRVNRKRLLIICQSILAALALVLFVTTHTHAISPLIIYFVLAFAAATNSFNMPARQTVLIHLVPREIYINAVSLTTMQRQTAIIIGPAIAGFIIYLFGVETIYLYNTLSFLALIFAFAHIKIPPQDKKITVPFNVHSVKEGIHFVLSKPILYSTMILDFLANFFGTAQILMPIFAQDVLHVGSQGLGFLYSAPAVGGVLAGLYFSGKQKVHNQGKIIISSVVMYGAAIVAFGLSHNFYLSLFFLSLMGMGDMISTILRNTIRQMITPDHIRGRMVSINMLFVQGGPQLGDMEAGFLANVIGAPITTVIGGVGTILITLLVAKAVPSLRAYDHEQKTV